MEKGKLRRRNKFQKQPGGDEDNGEAKLQRMQQTATYVSAGDGVCHGEKGKVQCMQDAASLTTWKVQDGARMASAVATTVDGCGEGATCGCGEGNPVPYRSHGTPVVERRASSVERRGW